MKSKGFLTGLLLGIAVTAIIAILYSKNQPVAKPGKYDWVSNQDSLATVTEGSNYIFAVKKNSQNFAPDNKLLLPVPSTLAIQMVKHYDALMNKGGLQSSTTYSVDMSPGQVLGYLANFGSADYSQLNAIRFYIGSYPEKIDADHLADRFSVLIVAVGNDGKEKYVDGNPGTEIQDLGSLCPTNCPGMGTTPADAGSIYTLAMKTPPTN